MKAYERLINYVKIATPSNEDSETVPSSDCQFRLARYLVKEMKELGIQDAEVDEKCYVYGTLPATPGMEQATKLGFIAHMDTVSDFANYDVKPVLHLNYDGKDLKLGDSGRILRNSMFPHLKELKGRTLITSDGTTVLGSDDKAGIAEIMTMVEQIQTEKLPHGPLSIGFTPDEEIGRGADYFDVARFGADYAYTVDGGAEGEIEYENFNACEAKISVSGVNVHPGSAKDVMVDAAAVACEFQGMLPEKETPGTTEGYEGFYHLTKIAGCCEKADLSYIVRDHDAEKFQQKKEVLQNIAAKLNQKYGEDTVQIMIKDQYYNMAEKIKPCFWLVENAKSAAEKVGIVPKVQPIRGGTDGARLSFEGLPCPNLGTGGYAFHGPFEHITVEGMDKVVEMLKEILNKAESVDADSSKAV